MEYGAYDRPRGCLSSDGNSDVRYNGVQWSLHSCSAHRGHMGPDCRHAGNAMAARNRKWFSPCKILRHVFNVGGLGFNNLHRKCLNVLIPILSFGVFHLFYIIIIINNILYIFCYYFFYSFLLPIYFSCCNYRATL